MKRKEPLSLIKNFKFIELISDIAIAGTILMYSQLSITSCFAAETNTFLGNAINVVLIFLYTFGLSTSLSNSYFDIAIKYKTLNVFRLVKNGFVVQSTLALFGIMLLAIIYSILSQFTTLTLSSFLIALQGIVFGFSFGIEYRLERDGIFNRNFERKLRKSFDHSLKNYLPYLVVTAVIMFPTEYVLKKYFLANAPLLFLLMLALVCYGSYIIARWLEKGIFSRLEIKKQLNIPTVVALAILPVLAIIGYELWEAGVITDVNTGNTHILYRIILLFFIGIIPIRLIHIIFARSSYLNKIIGVATLSFFILYKLNIIGLWK